MRLGTIVSIRKGKKPAAIVGDFLPGYRRLIQIDDLRSSAVAKFCPPARDEVLAGPDDVIIAWDGANAGTSNFGISGVIGSTLAILRPERDKVSTSYLGHFVRAQKEYLRERCKGATVPHIDGRILEALEIPLPSLAEQRRIADLLDRTEALRAKRRVALAWLDAITQSIFHDLFGDPGSNPKGWPRSKLGDVIFSASDGHHVSPRYADAGVPFLSTRHVRAGEITWEDLKFLSPEDARVHWKKCKPERGDILYTKGGTTGLAAVVRTSEAFAVWVHVALLKPDPAKVDAMWLESMLNCEFCYRQSQLFTRGIANRDLGLTRMVNIDVLLPPMELQREFTRRRLLVEEVRKLHRASLTELDALFAVIAHRAYRGEL